MNNRQISPYTRGEVMSQSLWSRYVRHFVGITWHDVLKIYHVIHTKFNQLDEENAHISLIINLQTTPI